MADPKTKKSIKIEIRDLQTVDVKFEPMGPALDPKSGPVGLLHDLNRHLLLGSCWAQNE